uniref:Alpha-tocopherol transfer protein-like n=3 Tax=Schistocephalus solidus TaxID=70667 RepID=A0A0X3Q469_SCHSO
MTQLPEQFVKLARSQLGEDEKQIQAHLISFRRWLKSMPHLSCPEDDVFLLNFLRWSKYNHAKAQKRLDNFCTLVSSEGISNRIWSSPVDITDDNLKKYLKAGIHVPLGKTKEGIQVMLIRMGAWDPTEIPTDVVFFGAFKVMMMQLLDPTTVIGGMCVVFDLSGVSSRHMQQASDAKAPAKMIRFLQESAPFRLKKLIYCNESHVFDAMFSIFSFYMNEKLKSRILRVGTNMETAYEAISGLKDVLPKELGGNSKAVAELTEENEQRFLQQYGSSDFTTQILADESKRPASAQNLLKEYKEYNPKVMGASGTFVRLQDDDI